jgi:hypothetical protein
MDGVKELIYLSLFDTTILYIAKELEKQRWLLRIGPAWKDNHGFVFDLTNMRRV